MTGRGVAFELGLVEFDEVLGLPPRAIVELLGPLGCAAGQRGDEGTDVHSQRRGVDAGDGSALEAAPAFGGMGRLAMGPVQGQVLLGPEQRAGVRCRGEQRVAPLAAALIGRPNRKSTPLSSHHAINAGRAWWPSPRSRMRVSGQWRRMRRIGRRTGARVSTPEGVLAGRSTTARGRARSASWTGIGAKPRAPWNPFQNAGCRSPCAASKVSSMSGVIVSGGAAWLSQ